MLVCRDACVLLGLLLCLQGEWLQGAHLLQSCRGLAADANDADSEKRMRAATAVAAAMLSAGVPGVRAHRLVRAKALADAAGVRPISAWLALRAATAKSKAAGSEQIFKTGSGAVETDVLKRAVAEATSLLQADDEAHWGGGFGDGGSADSPAAASAGGSGAYSPALACNINKSFSSCPASVFHPFYPPPSHTISTPHPPVVGSADNPATASAGGSGAAAARRGRTRAPSSQREAPGASPGGKEGWPDWLEV
ncbi:hypothetical protein T492DRAFT_841435 [Pavlovales sp. CCMP2436]|nr:hypothetical protein T492DRAFT_841435 [Pavlovales sp. CCMP2436]